MTLKDPFRDNATVTDAGEVTDAYTDFSQWDPATASEDDSDVPDDPPPPFPGTSEKPPPPTFRPPITKTSPKSRRKALTATSHGPVITIVSEDKRKHWTELATVFTAESDAFLELVQHDSGKHKLSIDPISEVPGLVRDRSAALRYRLKGVSPFDFEALLLGLKPKLDMKLPYEQLCPMLVLATDWKFHNLRMYCLREIPKTPDDRPVPRILLARRARVSEWLIEPYMALAEQLAPVSPHEAQLLGAASVLAISKAREKILERRLSIVADSYQHSQFLGKWFYLHPWCWGTLTRAWKRALTEEEYEDLTPDRAVIAALEEGKRKGDWLCASCDAAGKIVDWLELTLDTVLARSFFDEAIGDSIELWIED